MWILSVRIISAEVWHGAMRQQQMGSDIPDPAVWTHANWAALPGIAFSTKSDVHAPKLNYQFDVANIKFIKIYSDSNDY